MAGSAPVLARLATAVKYQGTDLGKAMLRCAIDKVNGAVEVVEAACLFVHAKAEEAK